MVFFASKTETVQLFFHVLPFVLSGRGCFFETYVDVGFLQRQNSLSKASKQKKRVMKNNEALELSCASRYFLTTSIYVLCIIASLSVCSILI